MLANPVVVPAYADGALWCIAFVAMWAEVRTEVALLRRSGWGRDVWRSLLLFNILTWTTFLLAMDALVDRVMPLGWAVALLETAVVVVEWALIWLALSLRARTGAGPAVTALRVFAISLVGNLVSILVSVAVPMTVWVLDRLT